MMPVNPQQTPQSHRKSSSENTLIEAAQRMKKIELLKAPAIENRTNDPRGAQRSRFEREPSSIIIGDHIARFAGEHFPQNRIVALYGIHQSVFDAQFISEHAER